MLKSSLTLTLATLAITTAGVTAPTVSARAADKLWTDRENGQPLVVLPNFAPLIDQVDRTIVNVAGTTEPKKDAQRKQQQQQRQHGPQQQQDPFNNPEDFFERFFGGQGAPEQQQQRRTLGSGFIISKDGYIVTNNHVVEGSDKIEITLLSSGAGAAVKTKKGNTFQAKVVGRDPGTDVALLKIDTGFELPVLPLADSTKIKKGEWVLAFGNPFGLDHSVSAGIVSAIGREISSNENRRFDDFIQTDAAINFGNSGGPLVNLNGEAVGINTAITAQGSGIGFAVPINIAKDVVSQLRDKGSVTRGYLGVMIQDVNDEIKDAMGLATSKGVLVNDVVADGPAGKALKRGDVILKVNSAEVDSAKKLQQEVAKIKPGNEAQLEIVREKKSLKVAVKVGALGDEKEKPKKGGSDESDKADKLGIVADKTPDNSAVQIVDVENASAAMEAGLAPGDIIRKVNGQAVSSVAQYSKIISGLKAKSTALFDVERGSVKLFIAFRVP